nr:Chain B, Designed protein DHD1:234_B [synthetic construct]
HGDPKVVETYVELLKRHEKAVKELLEIAKTHAKKVE